MKKIIIYSTILFFLFTVVTQIQAQTQQSPYDLPTTQAASPLLLSINPPTSYVHVKPGETLEHEITLTNNGPDAVEVTMDLRDFTSDGETGQPVIGQGSIFKDLISSSLNMGKPFKLKAGQSKTISFDIIIADSAAQREYPLVFLFQATRISSVNSFATQVSGVIGSNLVLLISPSDKNQGILGIEQADCTQIVDSFGIIKFSLVAKNIGANATPIKGNAQVFNLFNKLVKDYVFYPDMILAGGSRQARGLLTSETDIDENGFPNPASLIPLRTEFTHDAPFMFGLYTVAITIGPETRLIKVLALPFSLLGLMVIGFATYGGYLLLSKKFKGKNSD